MFMKIDTVDGESKDSVHKNEIDVLAWSWGYSHSGSAQVGSAAGGAGAGKVNVQALSFTKWVDSATPKLALACFSGQHLKEAILVVRKAGAQPVEYLKINMVDVLIASASTGGSSGEDRLTENVTLNFAKVALDYVPQDDKGVAGTAIPMTWSIVENVSIPRTSLIA
jgi:type VI secretion system secreted protein Hcp